ncbi:uncharacterized protein [Dendropsophus ebraccatus]|uniref:uncharacterized protein n=1 Tax=Dendropsophus ebraccatus TaxID=150705 RepID=UPI0038314A38
MQKNPDRTYNVTSNLTLTPTEEDRERVYSCRVHHFSLAAPLQVDVLLIYQEKEQPMSTITIIFIPVCIIVVLMVITIIAVIVRRRKHNIKDNGGREAIESPPDNPDTTYSEVTIPEDHGSTKKPQTTDWSIIDTGTLEIGEITPSELIAGEDGWLECILHNYIPAVHTVNWFQKRMDIDKPIAIKNDGRRRVTTERDQGSGDQRTYMSRLALTPVTGEDRGTKYICIVELPNSKEKKEKRTGWLRVTEGTRHNQSTGTSVSKSKVMMNEET